MLLPIISSLESVFGSEKFKTLSDRAEISAMFTQNQKKKEQ